MRYEKIIISFILTSLIFIIFIMCKSAFKKIALSKEISQQNKTITVKINNLKAFNNIPIDYIREQKVLN